MTTLPSFLFIVFTLLIAQANKSRNKLHLINYHITTKEKLIPVHVNLQDKLRRLLREKKAASFILGTSRQGKNIEANFFPGLSDKRALVIGGVHGSELSSIEVACKLIQQLGGTDKIHYSVIVIPVLFPDNAETAKQFPTMIGATKNVGRYSFAGAVDPNRQMPTPGKSFDELSKMDSKGRPVEKENSILLELIDQFRPHRIVSLHAIHNISFAGVFADPRTDQQSIALGYETDSSLAITMALHIQQKGGFIPGNKLMGIPTALYYKDPIPVPMGTFQPRNYSGSSMPGQAAGGVSLGTWAATSVYEEKNPSKNRESIRILTIEFPGCKRPDDYKTNREKEFWKKQVELYASSIVTIFLQKYYEENWK